MSKIVVIILLGFFLNSAASTNQETERLRLSLLLIDSLKTEKVSIHELQSLIDLGADVNFEDKYKENPLMIALSYQYPLDHILFLIRRGGNFNHKNMYGLSVEGQGISL